MKKLFILLSLSIVLFSCKKEPLNPVEVCPGGCNTTYTIPSGTLQTDGYWHVKFNGPTYFSVNGNLSQLNSKYVINGVPLVEANFDSDYWVLFDTIKYVTPMYSYLGWYTNNQFTTPISIGTHTYTLQGLTDLQPPLNIAGYQLSPHMCFNCPYTTTLIGTHSRYNYTPHQNYFISNYMIGDTANLFIQTIFNSDVGPRETKNDVLKVIFE